MASGYLAKPASGSGPGVLVIQEWWGLDDSLKEMADRLAAAGFVALAPDLYHGQVAGHTEMDKAAKLMQALPPDRAGRDMSGAVDYLAGHERRHQPGASVSSASAWAACWRSSSPPTGPTRSRPSCRSTDFRRGRSEPDWSKMTAAVSGHMAEHDDFFSPAAAQALEKQAARDGQERHADRASRHRPRLHGSAQRARDAEHQARRAESGRRSSRS